MSEVTVLPEDIENHDGGHAGLHNSVNGQVNWLTLQVAGLLAEGATPGDLEDAVAAVIALQKGAANGLASLGGGGRVPLGQLGSSVGEGRVLGIVGGNSQWVSPAAGGGGGIGLDVTQAPYSADPTGNADCSGAFNAALADQVPFVAKPSVVIPPGTYAFDHPIAPYCDPTAALGPAIRGAGKTLVNLVTTAAFSANHPGAHLMSFHGSGVIGGTVSYLVPGTPLVAAGAVLTSLPTKSGWCPQVGNLSATSSKLNFKAGALVGDGVLTVHVDQSTDPTFPPGSTTTTDYTLTKNAGLAVDESNVTKTHGGAGHLADWTADWFRLRIDLAGTPTSWPITVSFVNDYTPVTGLELSGFRINATGSPTDANVALGMDLDGRWNSQGILLDRVKMSHFDDLWVNKCRGYGLRLTEVFDSYFGDVKVLKCGDAATGKAAVSLEGFDPYNAGSNSNQNDWMKLHLEDNKHVGLYLGRRCRRNRFYGMKSHGDLASNDVMTLAPHVLLESAFTNQFVGFSFNRAGASHVELREHPLEAAEAALQVPQGGRTMADRNVFVAGYMDSARTNTTSTPGTTPSVLVAGGAHNRWIGCTWSSNPKALHVESKVITDTTHAAFQFNVGNEVVDSDLHDLFSANDHSLPATVVQAEVTAAAAGLLYVEWRHPYTGVRYVWNGVTLSQLTSPSTVATFSRQGAAAVVAGTQRFRVVEAATIGVVSLTAGTAPTGTSLVVDIKRNGVSIYAATPANRPTLAAAATSTVGGTPDTVTVAAGDLLTVDIVQVGATVAGADLTVQVQLIRA